MRKKKLELFHASGYLTGDMPQDHLSPKLFSEYLVPRTRCKKINMSQKDPFCEFFLSSFVSKQRNLKMSRA